MKFISPQNNFVLKRIFKDVLIDFLNSVIDLKGEL